MWKTFFTSRYVHFNTQCRNGYYERWVREIKNYNP